MLILQGGRDYQVTVADDLASWQQGLADDPDVTIRVYPDHNHLVSAAAGPPTPAARLDQPYSSDPGVVSSSPVSSQVLRPERIIGQPP